MSDDKSLEERVSEIETRLADCEAGLWMLSIMYRELNPLITQEDIDKVDQIIEKGMKDGEKK